MKKNNNIVLIHGVTCNLLPKQVDFEGVCQALRVCFANSLIFIQYSNQFAGNHLPCWDRVEAVVTNCAIPTEPFLGYSGPD